MTKNPTPDVVAQSALTRSESAPEEYPFYDHDVLKKVLPLPSSVRFAWLRVERRTGHHREHSLPTMVLVFSGSGYLEEDSGEARQVATGDVLTIPANTRYRLRAADAAGLDALAVTFDASPEQSKTPTAGVTTLAALLARNDEGARRFCASPFMRMLSDGTLDNPIKRNVFLQQIRRFSDAFQKVIFTRQATTVDSVFEPTFLAHFREEWGHNTMLPTDHTVPIDPIVSATSTWFVQQMIVLDNVDKAVLVHLVLETAGYHFHTKGTAITKTGADGSEYFATHAVADMSHMELGEDQLGGLSPETYVRLGRIVDNGWDTHAALCERIVQLVKSAS